MSTHIKSSVIRRLTRLAKSLHPLMTHIPRPLPRPNTEAFKLGKADMAKDAQKRQEEFERVDSRRLDKGTIRFFCESASVEGRR